MGVQSCGARDSERGNAQSSSGLPHKADHTVNDEQNMQRMRQCLVHVTSGNFLPTSDAHTCLHNKKQNRFCGRQTKSKPGAAVTTITCVHEPDTYRPHLACKMVRMAMPP
eukprot:1155575-Pelagomonas_calceolata.AAC.3